nr:MAG TPA: hypothetical protein [Caudoviricetes sp.]
MHLAKILAFALVIAIPSLCDQISHSVLKVAYSLLQNFLFGQVSDGKACHDLTVRTKLYLCSGIYHSGDRLTIKSATDEVVCYFELGLDRVQRREGDCIKNQSIDGRSVTKIESFSILERQCFHSSFSPFNFLL